MLRLPRFDVSAPDSVEGVVAALAEPGSRLVAGGTDLLPNLKHRLEQPARLVSLHRVQALRAVTEGGAELVIGAGITLRELAGHPRVRELFPSLAQAAGLVAGPQLRAMATLGGNVNLDTRCRYVNQTPFWRSAIGGCLKSEGTVCHVVPGGQRCVAALSSDCVPVLASLDARLTLVGPEGQRDVPILEYYRADGIRHTVREDSELTTTIHVPLPTGPRRTSYVKWRVRGSIDFPLISVALRFDLDGKSRIERHRVVAGVIAATPRLVERIDGVLGRRVGEPEVADAVANAVHRTVKPLPNVPYDPAYRRKLHRVLVRRAVAALGAGG